MLRFVQTTDQLHDFGITQSLLGFDSASSETATASTAVGSVNRFDRRASLLIYMYFRLREVVLPPVAQHCFLNEVRAAYTSEIPADAATHLDVNNAPEISLEEIIFWQFCRFRKVGAANEVVIRAPKGLNITCVDCGEESYGQVLAIDVRSKTFLCLRWFTPTFPGSATRNRGAVSKHYTTIKLTNRIVVLPLDQVNGTVHMVPNFVKGSAFFYINNSPLGSTLRARPWEEMIKQAEHSSSLQE
jgi:hypothetical protein